MEYSEEEDVCTQQTSTNPVEAVYLEEWFEIYYGIEFETSYWAECGTYRGVAISWWQVSM